MIGITPDIKGCDNPIQGPLLYKDLEGNQCKQWWHYCSAVRMSSYLHGSTCLDTSMSYLSVTSEHGIIYTPNPELGIQYYVDADFAGGWNKVNAENPENIMSRTEFVIMYAGCPVLWQRKLQTEIAFSTAEVEYIALSSAMREVIPFMQLLTELSQGFDLDLPKPE
eukprot:11147152-Ditylum_brightwellii.AAC.1